MKCHILENGVLPYYACEYFLKNYEVHLKVVKKEREIKIIAIGLKLVFGAWGATVI